MKNILAVFAVFILPIYFIVAAHITPQAAEQIAVVETTTTTTEEVKPKNNKQYNNSPAAKEKIMKYRKTLPENVAKEVENFHEERLKLKEAGEKLYNNLSVEAKIALKEERKIRINKK